jgi:hypothetical protein
MAASYDSGAKKDSTDSPLISAGSYPSFSANRRLQSSTTGTPPSSRKVANITGVSSKRCLYSWRWRSTRRRDRYCSTAFSIRFASSSNCSLPPRFCR